MMGIGKWTTRWIATGSLAAVACITLPLQAQNDAQRQREQEREKERQREERDRQSGQSQQKGELQLCSQLLEANINSEDGQNVGKVRNMALDTENGRIVYVILNKRNSDKLIPIPFSALRFTSNAQTARLNVNSSRLDDAPDFDPSGWNTINDTRWGRIVHQHYGMESEYDRLVGNKQLQLAPVKQAIGANCVDRQREQIGKCEDMLVHPQQGAVPFVLLTLDKNQGEDRVVAAPIQVCDFSTNQKTLTVRANRNQLTNAPTFNRGSMQANARWAERVYSHYNVEPNEFFGYTPPTDDDNRDPNRDRDRDRDNDDFAADSWQTNSRYGQMYDEDKITTINGRVTGVERITPMQGMQQGVQLNVRGDDNRNHRVHLGPVWFIDRQQNQFSEGDQIQVVGSEVSLEGQRIIMANFVRENDRVLMLRQRNGSPAWDAWREMSALRNNPEFPRSGSSRDSEYRDRDRDD
jgi:hypothetical protein